MKCFSFLLLGVLLAVQSFAISPITGTAHVCAGNTTPLADATTGGIWVSGNALVATVGSSSGTVSGIAAGTSIITYIAAGGYATVTVTVRPLPTAFSVGGGGSYCAGDSGVHVTLSGSQLGVNYLLYLGASSVGPVAGTGSGIDFGLLTAPGNYVALGTATATGCSSIMSGSAIVSVTPVVADSVSIYNPLGDTICAGTSDTFRAITVNGGATPHYAWMVNGVHVGADTDNYAYVPANGDVVSLRLVSSLNCVAPDTVTSADILTVLLNVMPTVDITAVPGKEVCRGTIVVLTAAPAFSGPSPSYYWKKNGVTVDTGISYTFVPQDRDTIHCIMISDYQCLIRDTAISPKTTMLVDTPLTPYITIVPTPGYVIMPGQSDTLKAVVTNPGLGATYMWIVDSTIVNDTTDTYISSHFSAPYPDSITCIVTGSGACRVPSYTWAYIVVSDLAQGVNPVNPASDAFTIFPNPNNGTFTLKGTFEGIKDSQLPLTITDVLGRSIYTTQATVSGGQVNAHIVLNDGKTISSGIYFITLQSGPDKKVFRMQVQ